MPDSSVYPGPPQVTPGLFSGDPTKLLGAIGQINALQRFQSEQGAHAAYTDSLGPNGADPNALASGLRTRNATFGAPEVMSSALAQRGQSIQNDTASFSQLAAQNDYVRNLIAQEASNPKANAESVRNLAVTASRQMDPRGAPSSVIDNVMNTLRNDPQGIPTALKKLQTQVAGAGTAMQRVQGPPDASGAPTSAPLGQLHAQSGAIPIGLPPGTEKSAGAMQEDLLRARNFGQEIFPWQQALDKLQKLGPAGIGPGTEGRKQIASYLYTALGPTISRWGGIDPERLKNFDEAQKYLTQATLQRAASFGHGTDQQLATTITGNPNVHINDLAATDVTKMAIAVRRMEHAQTLTAAKAGPVGYSQASADFAAKQDPRAYAIDMMSPEQVGALQKSLKGPERDKFNRSLKMAIDAGVVTPPSGK